MRLRCFRAARTLLLVSLTAAFVNACGALGGVGTAQTPVRSQQQPAHSFTKTPGEPAALAGITAAHNRVRGRVGAPPLKWNPALAEMARAWANQCVDDESPRGLLDHSPSGSGEPVGENIYGTTAPAADPVAAVDNWASEAAHYDHKRNTCSGGICGHYTQLVWSTTREVGCGVGSCPRLKYRATLVCNYAPAGNVVGQRPYP